MWGDIYEAFVFSTGFWPLPVTRSAFLFAYSRLALESMYLTLDVNSMANTV
jgi:hypothetical protein